MLRTPATVAPSLLAADFAHLADELTRLEQAGADSIHLDVMDGRFVPNITFGPPLVACVRKYTSLPLDAHLMVENPSLFIQPFAQAGVQALTIHYEITQDQIILEKILHDIAEYNLQVGLSIKPDTPVEAIHRFLPYIDRFLLMSVYPGFGGQAFIEESLQRLTAARQMIDAYTNKSKRIIDIQIDGGITLDNVAAVRTAGADNIVAGTTVFRATDMRSTIDILRNPTKSN